MTVFCSKLNKMLVGTSNVILNKKYYTFFTLPIKTQASHLRIVINLFMQALYGFNYSITIETFPYFHSTVATSRYQKIDFWTKGHTSDSIFMS